MTADADVVAHAARAGVLRAYHAAGGRGIVHTPPRTAQALLDALGSTREPRRRRSGTAPRCLGVDERIGPRRGTGVWLNTYTLRGNAGIGIGSFAELAAVIDWAGDLGCDFVGLSPLHLLRNVPPEISPYSPTSRLWRNPLYLDLAAIPESRAPEVMALWAHPEIARERERLEGLAHVDYARTQVLLARMVAPVHARFVADCANAQSTRARAYARFIAAGGEELRDLATFQAIEAHGAAQGWPRDFRAWPAELREPSSESVEAFRLAHTGDVSLHTFLQFEMDRQLSELGARATRAGLAIGLYNDLAIGSHSSGFDAWAHPDLFVPSVTVGAPPDDYAEQGQDWGFAPMHPHRVAANGSPYFSRLIDAGMAHMGALRIDHVMGLFRQLWIPAGMTGKEGAYVRFPATALLDTLAETSQRRGALVVGEDLGTVPRTLPPVLTRRNVLSYRVLLFERERGRGFKPADRYSSRALVTATTHDHPTLPGYARGRDLEIQRNLGRIAGDAELAAARDERERDLRALAKRIEASGIDMPNAGFDVRGTRSLHVMSAIYRFLARTPSPLLAVSLDDLAGEIEPVNVPGESVASYPCWSRRMGRSVVSLTGDQAIADTLRGIVAERRTPRS